MPPAKKSQLVAVTSFRTADRVHVAEGQVVDADDPVVKGRENLFVSVEVAARPAAPTAAKTAKAKD